VLSSEVALLPDETKKSLKKLLRQQIVERERAEPKPGLARACAAPCLALYQLSYLRFWLFWDFQCVSFRLDPVRERVCVGVIVWL
jgi:hypothetical protein